MSKVQRLAVCSVAAIWLAACSSAPTTREMITDAVTGMGGIEALQSVELIVAQGGGSRTRLGQSFRRGEAEEPAQLSNLVETIDLSAGRAAHEYDVSRPGFMQHRKEVITKVASGLPVGIETVAGATIVTSVSGLFSWAAHNSPEALLRRNVVTIVLGAAERAEDQATEEREFNGRMCLYGTVTMPSGEQIGLYFNPESRVLEGFETTDTETMLGDVPAQYILSDYRPAGNVSLPHRVTIRKQGSDYADVQYTSISINDPAAADVFTIPETLASEANVAAQTEHYVPFTLTPVAEGIYHAVSFRHHSMVVEFPEWVAVVEAPYTEAQSLVLARQIEAQFQGKPIRYAVVTHPHFDHTGGVRGIAALGATVITERRHEEDLRELRDAPHTNPPDRLAERRNAGQATGSLEVFEEKHVISDGSQTLELYAITGSPHVEPMVIAYVPGPRVLFQSDLFFPGTGAGGPAATHLLESVRALNLRVDTMVGGHGGVGPFSELVAAAAATPSD